MKCSIFPRYKWLGNELLSVSISRVGIIKQLSNFYLGLLYSIVRILYPKENLLRHSSLSSAFSSLWSFLIILCCFLQFPHWAYFMLRFVPPIQVQCLPVYIKTTTIFLKSSVFCYSYYIWRSQWWHCHISHTHIHISWLFPIFPDHLVEWMISMSNHKMTGSVGNFHEHKE